MEAAAALNPANHPRTPPTHSHARTRQVYAVLDRDGDGSVDDVVEIVGLGELQYPTGVAWRDGSLYVGALGECVPHKPLHGT